MYQKRGFAPIAATDPAGGSPAGGYVRRPSGGQRHPLRRDGERRHEREWVVRPDLVADVDAVPGEDAVPAGGLGGLGQLHLLAGLAAGEDHAVLQAPTATAGDCAVGQVARRTATWTTDAAAAPR